MAHNGRIDWTPDHDRVDKKSVVIAFLAILSLYLSIELFTKNQLVEVYSGYLSKLGSSDKSIGFIFAIDALDEIESSRPMKGTYVLYKYADLLRGGLAEDDLPDCMQEDFRSFGDRYTGFMHQACEDNLYDACLSYGEDLIKREEFEPARVALLKSAENQDFVAMSVLVDLYRNKKWSGSSEDKAQEWLMKIGKNSSND